MDENPVQIIDIEKDEKTKKSTYNFKFDALHSILSQVNDKEVAVISIAGPSRQGKSFLLSYLLRYLSNPNDNGWIGKDDEPLKGFKWNYGTIPETKGVWIWSKPFIVKQSVGKEIAIIVMDTQGVYDENTDVRDWSTIVGITLLTSSCFIFNVFTDIQENVLTQLETFMNYGLLAMDRDEANKHSFQRLLFLIRDWNSSRQHNYGRTGGNDYITEKLSIKSSQPQQAQRTREMIKQCFEDVACYLMPEPGDKRHNDDFDGSVDKLSPKFVLKLKELFSVLLNPESLKPKVINGDTITGRDLLKFFEVFVEKFNGDELPQPMDLVEAVTKATDLNLIYKLKESYNFRMNQELKTKHFLSKKELKILSTSIINDINEKFKNSRKSKNYDIVKQLTQMFETELRNAFIQIYSDNEKRREEITNDAIAKCINNYCESMDKLTSENRVVKAIIFDKQLIESKNLAKKCFTEAFGVEEVDSYLLRINNSIEEIENSFRTENHRRKYEFKKTNTQAVNGSVTFYRQQFQSILDKKVFFTSENLSQCEQEIRSKALEYLTNNCSGDQNFVEKSKDLMELKLNVAKSEFEAFNRNKMKETIDKTEVQLTLMINSCKQRINKTLELFSGSEDLDQINADIKQNTIEMFERKCNVEDSNFLSPYIYKLSTEIDKILVEFINDFKAKTKNLNDFYENTVEEAMNRCFVETLFKGKSLQSEEESTTFRENLHKDVIKKYENVPKQEKFDEIKDFVFEKTASAADLLLIESLTKLYAEKMTETLRTKNFFSREQLSQVHSEKSQLMIETFKAHNKTTNSQILEEFIVNLNDNLKDIFDELYSQNEQNREKCVEEAIDSSLCLYGECMAQKINHVCIESNKFDELNTESKSKALKQLNDVCGEENDKELTEFYISKLSKLIETEEYKFRSENDTKLKEANRKNSKAVNNSLEYYSEQMNKALNENLFHSEESFKRYEENVREESFNKFIDNCKYGEKEFINTFEFDLNNKIKFSKSKFKSNFRKTVKVPESEIVVVINDALNQYNDYMYLLLDVMKDEQQFSSKHEEAKAKAIYMFKQKCLLKDDQYRDDQISKLEKAINESCNEFHDRFLNQQKKPENYYEKFVNNSFASYAKLMEDLFKDNISISEEELENLHQNIVRDVLSEFEDNFQNEVDGTIIESNRRALEIKITNEFQSIKSTNKMRNESNESSNMELTNQIQDNIIEYEERMEETISFPDDDIVKGVFSDIDTDFIFNEEDIPVIESNKGQLEIKITNEFQSIKSTNKMRNESNENSNMELTNQIQDNFIENEKKEEMISFSDEDIGKDAFSEFENNLTFNEENYPVIESQSIERKKSISKELNEKSDTILKLEIKDFANEYEERMDKMIPFCGDETELLEQHLEIENIIKKNFIDSNQNLNPKTLEPYLTQLEVEINKSFIDFNLIFKVNLEKQLLSLQNVIMNARKFYRDEMQKYYVNNNFLKLEKLIIFNSSVSDRTIAKYRSERGNMSIEKFENAIKDSLKDIYNSFVEENNKNTPTLPSIGIDLGTTNSCVAFYEPAIPKGRTIIIPNDLGNRTTPSVVSFTHNNEEVIGEAAKEESYRRSRYTIYSAKRLIGRQFDDKNVQNDMLLWPFKVVDGGYNIAKICVKVDGIDKFFFPEEISAKILKKLKKMTENHLGCEVKNAVITVPAYFNEAQKEATKDAGKIAGLNVLKIINEPTAAALAFQLNRSDELGSRKVLIFDFGGGTLDVVVLTIERGVIDIKAVGGDNHLGGDDIDAKLVDYCLNEFIAKTQIKFDKTSEDGEIALRRLTTECEKRKRQLCSTNSAKIIVDHFHEDTDLSCELTREKFEELTNGLFVKSIELVAQVLCDANLDHSDIDDVVLVGGTTRIPKIQEMLTDIFYGKPLNHSVNPDEAVAVGAAIQAAIINGNLAQSDSHLKVSDVTPMSLGVRVKDGFMSVIVHRNSKVPNKCTKQYETTADNQTEVDIEIYEGEETMAEDNRKLGTFTLSNIPPGPVGSQQIEVNFIINDEGILHVNAKIMSNGKEEEILITEHKGRLSNAELQQLIDEEIKS